MVKIRLVRYANEGFANYEQLHIQGLENPVVGCHAFIEEHYEELLSYTERYHSEHTQLRDRIGEKKHELFLSSEEIVWVKNIQLVTDPSSLYISEDKGMVIVHQEPIQKSKGIMGMEFPLPMDAYVPVPLSFAKKQLEDLLVLYEWIRENVGSKEQVSINTKLIDFCQCIVKV